EQLISPDDLHLYQIADNAKHAVRIIARFYRNYHSSRFVKDQLVLRLKNAPSSSAIEALNEDFADIMTGQKIHVINPTPEEQDDKEFLELPRIAFGFDRRQYGRLREMIDVLNSY
ncbi:MAG: hypothetical protein JWO95_2844, partial [Verrucomicrobiales bacterium]|nr:hypothetical protein [Verrucomicrobiales bacterium]